MVRMEEEERKDKTTRIVDGIRLLREPNGVFPFAVAS
jgi:hypothetical protein